MGQWRVLIIVLHDHHVHVPVAIITHKRNARVRGCKMSGSAFRKLLSRLAAEGQDLSTAVDLKEHWTKHGTNHYITIRQGEQFKQHQWQPVIAASHD